jgi:prepilin-type N-terminal cleavage/methylation domain-containing protein
MKLTMSLRSRRAPAQGQAIVRSKRSGMTLIEVIVAISLLAGALLSMGALIARYAKVSGTMQRRVEANELVADRLEEVKGGLNYVTLEAVYVKTEATITGHPGLTRKTLVTHTGGAAPSLVDYKTVTVVVTGPGLLTPSKKTTVISVF